jgi:hypothetical protein
MNALRRILRYVTLGGLALLVVLSIVGAFLGQTDADTFFNSWPLAVYWVATLLLLVGGLFAFRSMLRRVGMGMMHLGCIAILAGGMWSSEYGHDLRTRHLGETRIRKAWMPIDRGNTTGILTDARHRPTGAQLPFQLKLRKFWVEYHKPAPKHWPLSFMIESTDERGKTLRTTTELAWKLDQGLALPGSDIELTVLQYFDNDQYQPDPGGMIRVTVPDGETVEVPARPGTTGTLEQAGLTFEVGELGQVPPRQNMPPMFAARITVRRPGQDDEPRLALSNETFARETSPDGLILLLRTPNYNPNAKLPMLVIRLRRDETVREGLFAFDPNAAWSDGYDWLPLAEIYRTEAAWRRAGSPALLLENPRIRGIKDFHAHLVVVEEGKELPKTDMTIEVNDPLHYGGYHFYQNSYDGGAWRYTMLRVIADSALTVVYVGFVLLMAGTAVHFWMGPVARAMRKGGRDGD